MTTHPPLVWTPGRVIDLAAEAFGTDADVLLSSVRFDPLCRYRMVAYAAVRNFCGLSYLSIGQIFHRHHTTVMSGIKRAESDPELTRLYGLLAERLLTEGVG